MYKRQAAGGGGGAGYSAGGATSVGVRTGAEAAGVPSAGDGAEAGAPAQTGGGEASTGAGGGRVGSAGAPVDSGDEEDSEEDVEGVEEELSAAIVALVEEDNAPGLRRLLSGANRQYLNRRLVQSGSFHWQAPLHVACAKGALGCAMVLFCVSDMHIVPADATWIVDERGCACQTQSESAMATGSAHRDRA